MSRFPEVGNFLSYCRLVRCEHESAGKKKGSGGKKIGNAHLKWAFCEAACLMLRAMPEAKKWLQRQERKRGKKKALSVLEAKIGRTVYHLMAQAAAVRCEAVLLFVTRVSGCSVHRKYKCAFEGKTGG